MKALQIHLHDDQALYIENAATLLGWTKAEVVRVLIECGKEIFEVKYFNKSVILENEKIKSQKSTKKT